MSISGIGSYNSLASLFNTASTSASTTLSQSIMQTLESAFSSLSGASSGSGTSNAYELSLSSAAQAMLSGVSSSLSGSSSASGSSSDTFILSTSQKETIQSILEKYKNSPFNQTTFNSILSDLENAGLGPDQLKAQDQVATFNPTDVFLQALSGSFSGLTSPTTSLQEEDTKANNYLQSIVNAWESISTTVSSASGSSITT